MNMPVPILIAVALVGLVAAGFFVVGITKKWGILLPYGGMLLFGSMSLPLDWNDRIRPTIWLPIQQLRSEFFVAAGAAGLLMVGLQSARLRGKGQSISVWIYFFAGMYAALLRFVHDSPAQGAFSVVFIICTLIPLALTASIVMNELEDLSVALRGVALVNIAWIGMVFVQIAANSELVTMGNEFRFVGILTNPQHAGVLLAFLSVITLWLLLNDQRKYRLVYIGLLGINTLFLLWTGSRTGLGMALIGLSAVLYTKAGRAILLLPVAAIVAYVGLKVMVNVVGIDFGFERLASTTNTRNEAWSKLLSVALQNPLIGAGTVESEKSENSWLFGFAAFGIGMLALTILFTIAGAWEAVRLIRTRYWLPPKYRPYPDLIVGITAMYFAGAVLEGYMISRVNASLCIYPLIAGAGAVIRKIARDYHEAGDTDSYSDGYAYEDGGYEDGEYGDD